MENNLVLDFKPQDEMSDALSTSPTNSQNFTPLEEENSPSNAQSMNSLEGEVLGKSKKIRKKRNAYQKIDDDIRLKLLEAVQRGETLKSAAKRYQVNYSSAKSIFHIYRKEGRILKKATQEQPFGIPQQGQSEMEVRPPHFLPNPNPTRINSPYDRPITPMFPAGFLQHQEFRPHPGFGAEELSGNSSPLNGLVDNFAELLRIGGNLRPKDELMKTKGFVPTNPSRFNPNVPLIDHSLQKMQPSQQMTQQMTQQMSQQMSQQMNQQMNQQMSQQITQQMTLASKPNQGLSPAERMKHFGDFYMNYSNSPLSGRAAQIVRKGSESGSNKNIQSEFDSFSDMVSALQNQNHLTDSLKREPAIPKLYMPNITPHHPHEKFDPKTPITPIEEEMAWNGNLENAAMDTFKSFVDAQMVLSTAFRKANYLNNLVQIQKAKADGSPSFRSFQGN